MGRKLMNGEAAALRDGPNRFEDGLVMPLTRLNVNDHISGGDNSLNISLDCIACRMSLLEASRPRDADGHIDKIARPRAAHADALGLQHAVCVIDGVDDAFPQTERCYIEQCLHCAFTELRTDPDNHPSDAQGREWVEHTEPRKIELYSQPCAADPKDYHEGAPYVGRKMERVRFERFARIFFCHTAERPRSYKVDSHTRGKNPHGRHAGSNVYGRGNQPAKGFPNNINRGENQKACFDECGKALDFAVAVEMLGVGGFVRHAYRKIGDDCGDEVENRVQRF